MHIQTICFDLQRSTCFVTFSSFMSILTWVPYPYTLLAMINWWKKELILRKKQVPFEWKYQKTFHAFWIEFKFLNWIQIQLKRNGMQISTKGIENVLVTMSFKNANFKETQIWKDTFPFLFTWQLVKQIPIWNCHLQLIGPKVSLPKPIPMNDCHWNYKWSLKRWKFYNTLPWL
jgi:hypothetical protein